MAKCDIMFFFKILLPEYRNGEFTSLSFKYSFPSGEELPRQAVTLAMTPRCAVWYISTGIIRKGFFLSLESVLYRLGR